MFADNDLSSFEKIQKQPKIYNLLNQEDGSPIQATPMMRPLDLDFNNMEMEGEEMKWGFDNDRDQDQDPDISGLGMGMGMGMGTGPGGEPFMIPRLNFPPMNNPEMGSVHNIPPFSIPQFRNNNGYNNGFNQ